MQEETYSILSRCFKGGNREGCFKIAPYFLKNRINSSNYPAGKTLNNKLEWIVQSYSITLFVRRFYHICHKSKLFLLIGVSLLKYYPFLVTQTGVCFCCHNILSKYHRSKLIPLKMNFSFCHYFGMKFSINRVFKVKKKYYT